MFTNCPICLEKLTNDPDLDDNIFGQHQDLNSMEKSNQVEVDDHNRLTIKMTSSAVLGILCGHYFHWKCLVKWDDAKCPLCRYHQYPPETSMCEVCGATDDLWMCLVCGSISCGIEAPSEGHNRDHYEKTKHTYSMEIITKIVYDFSKNGYVHRLLQNAADGKIMEADDRDGGDDNRKKGYDIQKKVETISHEYNLLLTSQVRGT